MKYVEAVASVVRDLDNDGSAEVARAGLRLALLACRELGDTDAAWDRFGLQTDVVVLAMRSERSRLDSMLRYTFTTDGQPVSPNSEN